MAPVPAFAQDQGPCFAYSEAAAVSVLEAASVVVVGSVIASDPGKTVTIAPEFYLKGATLPEQITLASDAALPCPPAALKESERLLLILGEERGTLAWPGTAQVFRLQDGNAYPAGSGPALDTEAGLVESIRAITGQYSVPAASTSEGASLEWFGTVLPVTGAVLVVFVIGLVLMKEWHRIDPS